MPIITYIIIAFTVITSIISFPPNINGFNSIRKPEWFEKFKFNAYAVIKYKQYYRLLSYGFLHADYLHLFFNMLTLYFFGPYVEKFFNNTFVGYGGTIFLLYYLSAIVVSTIPDLIKHRKNIAYNAIGASGSVSSVIYTFILFAPTASLRLFFAIPIKAWIFGGLFLIFSAFMAKKQVDNIGHNAHFWGAIYGFIFPIIINPNMIIYFFNDIIS